MKILLVGDYSGVHFNLYKALQKLGHDVTLISCGDGVKQIPTQVRWRARPASRVAKILSLNGKTFINDNADILEQLHGYDVVQIINPILVEETSARSNLKLFKLLKERNGKVFLYSCGDDLNWVFASLLNKYPPTMFRNPKLYLSKEIYHPARYILDPRIVTLCGNVYKSVDGIIPGSVDYDWCLTGFKNVRNIVPFPIDIALFKYRPARKPFCPVAFHGVQAGKKIRKGDGFFESASAALSGRIAYQRIGGIPFLQYIENLGHCDIFFDQVYSQDQGMSALFAMACGKVVFSGFSERFNKYYDLKEPIGVDAKADVEMIKSRIVEILEGQINLERVGQAAREFVERIHEKTIVAEKFLLEWSS